MNTPKLDAAEMEQREKRARGYADSHDLNCKWVHCPTMLTAFEAHLAGQAVADDKVREMEKLFQRLLNMVNRVTANHRHGQPVLESDLTALSNRQIEVEQALKALKGSGL